MSQGLSQGSGSPPPGGLRPRSQRPPGGPYSSEVRAWEREQSRLRFEADLDLLNCIRIRGTEMLSDDDLEFVESITRQLTLRQLELSARQRPWAERLAYGSRNG